MQKNNATQKIKKGLDNLISFLFHSFFKPLNILKLLC